MRDWVLDMEAELNNRRDSRRNAQIEQEKGSMKRSIYKLPSLISQLNEKAYQPQLVSLGPYHHGKPHLKPMEDPKQRALLNFLERWPAVPLHKIFDSMRGMAEEIKASYDPLGAKWQDNGQFVQLMIKDGCFVLEILWASSHQSDYAKDDHPIFGLHNKPHVIPFLKRDMLLLENQLPMLVLLNLERHIKQHTKRDTKTLNEQILRFYGHDKRDLEMGECLHILDVYRKSLLGKKPEATKSTQQQRDICVLVRTAVVGSATELNEAGIRFKWSKRENLCDISFDRGVLSLPRFIVNDATESTFLNLLAFERCRSGAGHAITSFICFMDTIIKHDRDISLLSSKGIIINLLGTDKDAADLFNTMSRDLIIEPFSDLYFVITEMATYSGMLWRRWAHIIFALMSETHGLLFLLSPPPSSLPSLHCRLSSLSTMCYINNCGPINTMF